VSEGFVSRLHAAGLRATEARLTVLETLAALGGHRTQEELASALQQAGLTIPRASLYHVLGVLSRAGLLMVADAGPGVARYEVARGWHHHFVCRRCGAIIDVACASASKPCLEPALPGALVDEAQVIYRGLCPRCAKA
jgi:Fe2+ or Zn2+ uptake regulation protein